MYQDLKKQVPTFTFELNEAQDSLRSWSCGEILAFSEHLSALLFRRDQRSLADARVQKVDARRRLPAVRWLFHFGQV